MSVVSWPQYLVLALLCGLVIAVLRREAVMHQRNLESLKFRIHVNGTRGKSSVTRLIAAGLRAGGHVVVAKTTGSAARIILPDGTEQPIKRRGPANIREIIQTAAFARRAGADTIVFECMAVQPELQRFSEHTLMKSHIGVITNVRPDHEDVMGEGLANVAAALAGTIPANGSLVTTQEAYERLNAVSSLAGPEGICCIDSAEIPADYLAGFSYEIMPENIALALKVCEMAGVSPSIALTGMRQSVPDAGNLTISRRVVGNKEIVMINAFAANDPESTLLLWRKYVPQDGNVLLWLNARPDRRYRTAQLAEALTAVHKGDFLLSGDTAFARRKLLECGAKKHSIHLLPKVWLEKELERIALQQTAEKVTVFSAGNIAGINVIRERRTGADAACTFYS